MCADVNQPYGVFIIFFVYQSIITRNIDTSIGAFVSMKGVVVEKRIAGIFKKYTQTFSERFFDFC